MRYEQGTCKVKSVESINIKLDRGRKKVKMSDEKMSIATTDEGIIRMFWMQGKEGRLLSIDLSQKGPFKPEMVIPFEGYEL